MSELTEDEFTCLLLAVEGEYLAPIGRWKAPILALTSRGLMQKIDEVNYVVTADGRRACEERNSEDERALSSLLESNKKTIEARAEETKPISEVVKDE